MTKGDEMGRPTIRKDGTPLTGAEREARRRKRVGKSINRTRRKQRKDAKLANEDAERQGATTLAGVRLVQHGRLAAAVAFDAQEPGGEGPASAGVGNGSVPWLRQ